MKFGRRGRSRGREPIWARRSSGKPAEESAIEMPPTEGALAPAIDNSADDFETATDDILKYLAAFSRECEDPSRPLWSDACMNQLILCMEIAVEQGWGEVASVLEDTGRILQTYESADCPEKCAGFLQSSYNILCTMIGDIVVEKELSPVMEVWESLLASGLEDLANNGLSLHTDGDADDDSVEDTTDNVEEQDQNADQESAHTAAIDRLVQDVEKSFPVDSEALESEEEATAEESETADDGLETTHKATAEPEPGISLAARAVERDELPTLDALPPLESLVDIERDDTEGVDTTEQVVDEPQSDDEVSEAIKRRVDEPANNPDERSFALFEMPRPEAAAEEPIEEDVVDETPAEEPADEPAEVEAHTGHDDDDETEIFDPPRIVVDIIDRICDVLSQLDSLDAAARTEQLGVMTGGLEALGHEAKVMGSDAGLNACQSMMQACGIVRTNDAIGDDFIETGFAFCGIFIEALGEGASENVSAWQDECEAWLKTQEEVAAPTPNTDASSDGEEPEAQTETAPESVDETEADAEPEPDRDDAAPMQSPPMLTLFEAPAQEAPTESDDTSQSVTVEVPEVPEPTEALAEGPADALMPAKTTPDSDDVDHAAESHALLKAAQLAASSGNGEDAKTFALRAAAEIAKAEVQRADMELREAELKLKESVDLTSDSRKGVKSCESDVRDSSTRVEESRSTHAQRQQDVGQVAERLELLESGVSELSRQIQELQAKRDEEMEKVSQTVEELEEARQAEVQSHSEWEALKELEKDARQRLEEARQNVKEKQRVVQGIESEMERAREQLTQQKVSLSDITQAIQQISGADAGDVAAQDEGMLF